MACSGLRPRGLSSDGILGLDQPDQPVAAQGRIDHFDIARLEDVERPVRERQQQRAR